MADIYFRLLRGLFQPENQADISNYTKCLVLLSVLLIV
ncbi:hypothetical protein Dm11a5_1478 [Dehalococcoides mccartyi]|uniref:Uncharacterized protein n=1 Tax=Dehalococcoides mccartyi TaxID=61435 RepID=A0A142VBW7_9CHLR|nr:hypothetical protein Dm11a5_1478 [Dehalococcoides mccartyi]